jgi:hypothetical protein
MPLSSSGFSGNFAEGSFSGAIFFFDLRKNISDINWRGG